MSFATPRGEGFTRRYETGRAVLHMNLAGISHEDSLFVPLGGGNPMVWVVGHLVDSRSELLNMLGRERIWGQEMRDLFMRGTDGTATVEFPQLDELKARFEETHELLLAAFREGADE